MKVKSITIRFIFVQIISAALFVFVWGCGRRVVNQAAVSSKNITWLKQLGAITAVPGGSTAGDDACTAVAVDSSGNIYCAGHTDGALGEANGGGGWDAFVMKLNSSGVVQWVRQLGASTIVPGGSTAGFDSCNGIAVDSSGNVYCSGYTDGALGEANGGGGHDAFVMKLNSSGVLQWIRQLGATTVVPGGSTAGDDYCTGITVDSNGNVYCAGITIGALGEANGGGNGDAFVMKLNSSGVLQWIRQLGATTVVPGGSTAGEDACYGVAVDSSGSVFCSGYTRSALGEANGDGNADAFVMKLNSSGVLQWIRQLGATTVVSGGSTAGDDYCKGVTVDSTGNVYCAGNTAGALGEANGGGGNFDAFVMKLNSSGVVQWIRQLGATTVVPGGSTAGEDACKGVTVDSSGNVFCSGYTRSALGEANGGGIGDAFVMKLNSSGVLQWIRQLGATTVVPGGSTAGEDYCSGIALDSTGNVFCVGETSGSLGEANGGGNYDLFILKLNSLGTL